MNLQPEAEVNDEPRDIYSDFRRNSVPILACEQATQAVAIRAVGPRLPTRSKHYYNMLRRIYNERDHLFSCLRYIYYHRLHRKQIALQRC